MNSIAQAQESFGELIQSEFERIERMKQDRRILEVLTRSWWEFFRGTALAPLSWSRP